VTPLPDSIARSWQLAALSRDVTTRPVARTIANRPIVLFRADGALGVFEDRCPHRNYPLSSGQVRDGGLECAYHGWRFAPSGACLEVPGCTLAPGQDQRLGAAPLAVIERHGAIFVRLLPEGPQDLPDLGVWGAPGHDHFWWDQGSWRGRALDAIENVLDPFHTNFIHDGFIRRRGRRMPVELRTQVYEDGIESIIDQSQPDFGWMSRVLEPPRDRSRTRLYAPTTIQARWEGPRGLTLCVSAFFTPETPTSFRPYACFTTPKGRGPAWLKQAAIRLFLLEVVAQDRRALAAQLDTIEAFGGPKFRQGPGDLLGGRVARLFNGERLEPAEEGPFPHML
jgi:phenylpropionate dioxygenase-like ring-hydroxylating dioxygenase large terminal subunit